jgi:hypothetical protein
VEATQKEGDTNMIDARPVRPTFREGEEVMLADGAYRGTLGVFLRLKEDANWADITERNGSIRSHPVVWLAHATGIGGSATS